LIQHHAIESYEGENKLDSGESNIYYITCSETETCTLNNERNSGN